MIISLALLSVGAGAFLGARHLYETKRLRQPYQYDVAAIGVLALSTAGFFWRVIFRGDAWVPAGGGDLASFLYPTYAFAAQSLKQGILPLWNPYLYGGAPFAADIQSSLFYPVNLIAFLVLPAITYQTMEFLAIFHFFLAGCSMYCCLRFLRAGDKQVGISGALVGGIAYMFSDVFIVHLGNLNMIAVAAWLPLVFVLFHRSLVDRRPAHAAIGGIALGVALLAGHIQLFLYILLALALYFLLDIARDWRTGFGWRSLWRRIHLFAVFIGVALGVGSIQLIPSFELSQLSLRSEIDYAASTQYSLSPAQLISLFVPSFFGRNPGDYWGPWFRTEMGYVGVLTLVAALVAMVLRRQWMTFFFVALAALSLSLAFGGYSVTQGWLYMLGAGFDKVRAPARFLFLFDFALAALAGLGIDRLLSAMQPVEARWLRGIARFLTFFAVAVALGALPPFLYLLMLTANSPSPTMMRLIWISEGISLFIFFLAGSVALLWARLQAWVTPGILGGLAVALILFDLMTTGFKVEVGDKDPTANFQHLGVINFLKQDMSYYRVDSVTDVWDVWQPDTTLANGIFDIMGVYNPMILSDLERYWAKLGGRSNSLYDLLNAKYLIGHKNVPLDRKKFELVYDEDAQVSVFRNNRAMPRAFVVYSAGVAKSKDEAFEAIHADGFDPMKTVVVEEGQPLISALSGSEATIRQYSLNDLTIATNSAAPGYLVLSEVYHEGWKAWVDGQPEKVRRADFLFRAIPVPAGDHEVRLIFDPPSFRLGASITGLTWLALAGWGLVFLFRHRRMGV